MQDNIPNILYVRTIKSFVKRTGRLTLGQRKALETLLPIYGIQPSQGILNFDAVFNNTSPVMIEIGFGMGAALLHLAKTHPHCNYLGIEVYPPGMGSLLSQVQSEGLMNVRVSDTDANIVLTQNIPDESISGFYIFFPDPWHKKRHHKRRLIQAAFIKTLVTKLKPQGFIHLATDWENYAEHMLAVCNNESQLINQSLDNTYVPRPQDRPLTKYEKRGQGLGHGVWDLLFVKAG
jgi:tRNA (guanine-N7-)-methyltransferase